MAAAGSLATVCVCVVCLCPVAGVCVFLCGVTTTLPLLLTSFHLSFAFVFWPHWLSFLSCRSFFVIGSVCVFSLVKPKGGMAHCATGGEFNK